MPQSAGCDTMRFITFMTFISVVSVVSLILWSYIRQCSRKIAVVAAGFSLTMAAALELVYYGMMFPALRHTALFKPLYYGSLASLSWMVMFLICLPILLVVAAGCAVWRVAHRHGRQQETASLPAQAGGMTRRTFLKGATAALPAAALATSVYGNVIGDNYLDLSYHELYYPGLPDYLEGYRIGQISDAHIGLFFRSRDLQRAMDILVSHHANRLEITGDLIDELSALPDCQRVLVENAPRFPDGIDFCYGNHEYIRGIEEITAMLQQTPVRILRNTAIEVSPGRGAGLVGRTGQEVRPFYIVGVDYSFARGDGPFAAERREFVEKALQSVPGKAFVVMLAHHSSFIEEGFARKIPLILSGHTHGGQVAPLGPIIQAVGFPYLRGMYRQGSCRGYVSRGTGHWLPFRILCSREVSLFELHKEH